MYTFSDNIKAILLKNGWSEDRKIPTIRFEEILKEEGYPIFDKSINFLSSFGDLKIIYDRPYPNGVTAQADIHFSVDEATYVDPQWILDDYSKRTQSVLSLIGCADKKHLVLMISEKGEIYGGFDSHLVLFGNSVEESIENIITNNSSNMVKIPVIAGSANFTEIS